MSKASAIGALAALVCLSACEPEPRILDALPRDVDGTTAYLLFLPDPAEGAVPEAARHLARGGATVILERPVAEGAVDRAALDAKEHLRTLLAAGAALDRLAVAGVGRGGLATLVTAALMRTPGPRYVAVNACPKPEADAHPAFAALAALHGPQARGRVLSLVGPSGRALRDSADIAVGADAWESAVASDAPESWGAEALAWITE